MAHYTGKLKIVGHRNGVRKRTFAYADLILYFRHTWNTESKISDSNLLGMDGYILLERGIDQEGGQCGILESASYPVL